MEVDRGINSDDNGRDTPKEGYELPTRIDTPGPIPKYMYSRVSTYCVGSDVSKDHYSLWGIQNYILHIDCEKVNNTG